MNTIIAARLLYLPLRVMVIFVVLFVDSLLGVHDLHCLCGKLQVMPLNYDL